MWQQLALRCSEWRESACCAALRCRTRTRWRPCSTRLGIHSGPSQKRLACRFTSTQSGLVHSTTLTVPPAAAATPSVRRVPHRVSTCDVQDHHGNDLRRSTGSPSQFEIGDRRERDRLDSLRFGTHGLGVGGPIQRSHLDHQALRILAAPVLRTPINQDPIGIRLLDILGEDNVMWGSDFPHPDGVWPDSREFIERELRGVPETVRSKVICENGGTARRRFIQ